MALSNVVQSLKEEMERRELNALELSKLADVSTANLYDILRGDVNPTVEILQKVAKALKMKVVLTK